MKYFLLVNIFTDHLSWLLNNQQIGDRSINTQSWIFVTLKRQLITDSTFFDNFRSTNYSFITDLSRNLSCYLTTNFVFALKNFQSVGFFYENFCKIRPDFDAIANTIRHIPLKLQAGKRFFGLFQDSPIHALNPFTQIQIIQTLKY